TLGRAARGGEAGGAHDGVPHVPAGVHRDAMSDRTGRSADRVSTAGMVPVAASVPPWRRGAAIAIALLDRRDRGGAGRKPTARTGNAIEGHRGGDQLNTEATHRPHPRSHG